MTKPLLTYILGTLARRVILRYKPIVIGITGSVGKTFTKEVVARVLATKYRVRSTEKNFNNELGVPITVLGIMPLRGGVVSKLRFIKELFSAFYNAFINFDNHYPQVLVLELGADHPGDMRYLAGLVRPTIGIVTAIGDIPVHVEFYANAEAVAEEKAELIKALQGVQSLAVLNADDSRVLNMQKYTHGAILTFGLSADADIRASEVQYRYTETPNFSIGFSFTLHVHDMQHEVAVPNIFAPQQIAAFLAATAIGIHLGVSMQDIVHSFSSIHAQPGRMNLINGIKDTLIIDDTYNASPIAVEAALNTLNDLGANLHAIHKISRKVAILGDMRELGSYTVEAHKAMGTLASEKADLVIVVGEYADYYKEGVTMNNSKVISFTNSTEAAEAIGQYIQEGDLILVKGSQSARMERIVKVLMKEPSLASKLLVRQSDYWLRN